MDGDFNLLLAHMIVFSGWWAFPDPDPNISSGQTMVTGYIVRIGMLMGFVDWVIIIIEPLIVFKLAKRTRAEQSAVGNNITLPIDHINVKLNLSRSILSGIGKEINMTPDSIKF